MGNGPHGHYQKWSTARYPQSIEASNDAANDVTSDGDEPLCCCPTLQLFGFDLVLPKSIFGSLSNLHLVSMQS